MFTGTSPVPASFTWDGKDKGGIKAAPDGLYTANLTVEYVKGNVATARTAPFRLAVTPPKVDLTLQGLPFSPDNDGLNDELTIGLKVDDPVATLTAGRSRSWIPSSIPSRALPARERPRRRSSGTARPSTGELVQSAEDYPLAFTIKTSWATWRPSRRRSPSTFL